MPNSINSLKYYETNIILNIRQFLRNSAFFKIFLNQSKNYFIRQRNNFPSPLTSLPPLRISNGRVKVRSFSRWLTRETRGENADDTSSMRALETSRAETSNGGTLESRRMATNRKSLLHGATVC